MIEETIVRENLMTRHYYTPYCGSRYCRANNPRTYWDGDKEQFCCPSCNWSSAFPKDFIDRYKEKWSINHPKTK